MEDEMKHLLAYLMFCLLSVSAWASGTVNINQASAEEIAAALNGVGLSKAEEIVRYRETNGSFAHVDELVNVKGIGLKTVDKNRDRIVLQPASPEASD
jgi:competence protein ComEA